MYALGLVWISKNTKSTVSETEGVLDVTKYRLFHRLKEYIHTLTKSTVVLRYSWQLMTLFIRSLPFFTIVYKG